MQKRNTKKAISQRLFATGHLPAEKMRCHFTRSIGTALPTRINKEPKCLKGLACSCREATVIDLLKKIMFESVEPDIIVDLRNAVRIELDFGNQKFDKDRDKAFVDKVGADPDL